MPTLGDRIKELRTRKGWGQDKLSGMAGISKSFLSDVENDKRGISAERLRDLAVCLETSIDYLMTGKTDDVDTFSPSHITLPFELSQVAEERGLSYKDTLFMLKIHNLLLTRRSTNVKKSYDINYWRKLYSSFQGWINNSLIK